MVNLNDILLARDTIKELIKRTDVLKINKLSNQLGMNIFLKLENLQSSGSFKVRGAYNKVASLTKEELANGIICASAGNHAQGVAYAANAFNTHATIIMPKTAPISKINATRNLGAEVHLTGDIFDDAYDVAIAEAKRTNKTFIHAFDDELIIAGQGTIGLEIMEQVQHIDVVIVPIGGGGLISGVAVALKSINPSIKVIGVQAECAANMCHSFNGDVLCRDNITASIADGISVKNPGKKTFELIKKYVDDIVTVTEDEIAQAILYLLEQCKIVSEGSGAVPVAAILAGKIHYPKQNVVAIVSGGNIDVDLVETIINRGLIASDRRFELKVIIQDKPGEMQKLLAAISSLNGNIFALEQRRYDKRLDINHQEVTVVIGSYGPEHKEEIIEKLKSLHYRCYSIE